MIKLQAYLTGFSSRSDGGVGIRLTSALETSPEQLVEIQRHLNLFGWVLFSENEFTSSDLPKEQAEEGQKTPSKRLRATIFILWKQNGEKGDFEAFYRDRMEKHIDKEKSHLEPEVV